jgi:hypothetical protein
LIRYDGMSVEPRYMYCERLRGKVLRINPREIQRCSLCGEEVICTKHYDGLEIVCVVCLLEQIDKQKLVQLIDGD